MVLIQAENKSYNHYCTITQILINIKETISLHSLEIY